MKNSSLIIGIIALVAFGGGLVWFLVTHTSGTPAPSPSSSSSSSSSSPADSTANVIDDTQSSKVTVTMEGIAFSPQVIKIKKGTTVTWVNNDNVGHDVVAKNSGNAAGLPTDNTIFSKGGTYSFTFNAIGTIDYFCTVHPFMTGTVEVVE